MRKLAFLIVVACLLPLSVAAQAPDVPDEGFAAFFVFREARYDDDDQTPVRTVGLKARTPLGSGMALEGTLGRLVGSPEIYGRGLGHAGISFSHAVYSSPRGALGYSAGVSRFEADQATTALTGELWAVARLLGSYERASLSITSRLGGISASGTRGTFRDFVHAEGMLITLDRWRVRLETQAASGGLGYRRVASIEAGLAL